MKLISIKDKDIHFKNNYEGEFIELFHDIKFRFEYHDNNSGTVYLETIIFNPQISDFFINITTSAYFIGIKENTEQIHQKCFEIVWKHIQNIIKELTKSIGYVVPIELLNADELVSMGICRKKYRLNVL